MFHIDCPRFRGFMTWDDLGCLARAVGFQTDLFKSNITKHVTVEDNGMSVEQVNKMLDLRLLQRSIHRTRNLHTGEWNTKVIRKALYLMDHHALTFEELYNIRIAYKAFEGNDMRGMHLDEKTIMSALKMCGRCIAPLKMLHRIKHMCVNFEETDRMQLFEFLDLVLWADVYEDFSFDSMEKAEGKEGDLFKLVDFERLLSHHDKKLEDKLNNEYLQEEWDFGHEVLTADKGKFKEPPVICGDSRMQMAREQKLKYRYLKSELINSRTKMYKAKAGYIRDRPVTAPDLSMYEEEKPPPPTPEFTARTAYEIVQRKVKSANAAVGRTPPDLSDKPHIPSPTVIHTAKAVSDAELEETQKHYDQLKFDIETVQGRFDYNKNREIEFYFPGQLDRLTKQQEEKEESVAADLMKKTSSHPSKQKITQKEVNRLAYPPSRLPPSHAKVCDARLKQKLMKLAERFRGWHNVKSKKGSHFVLVAPSFENSYTGRLHKKLVESSNVPVKKIKGDFVHRYTKRSDVEKPVDQAVRPNTAPADLSGNFEEEISVSTTESPSDSCKTVESGYGSMEEKFEEGSSTENLISEDQQTIKMYKSSEKERSFPKPFENRKVRKSDLGIQKVEKVKEKKLISDMSTSEKSDKRPQTSFHRKDAERVQISSGTKVSDRPKTSPNIETVKNDEDVLLEKTVSRLNSSHNNNSNGQTKNNHIKNGFDKNEQKTCCSKSNGDKNEKSDNGTTTKGQNESISVNEKIEHYKKDLKKHTLDKRSANQKTIKSPPPLEFTFTSVLNEVEEDDFEDFTPVIVKTNKSAWFLEDTSSPDIMSPRNPEPVVYTMQKKAEKIDIENLPVPHFEYSKPKTVSVGTIGKISLLESITESTFWEDMIEETYRSSKLEEVAVNENVKEQELADLKEEEEDDLEDTVSNDSGVFGNEIKSKAKTPKKKKINSCNYNIDDKLTRAREERLKRQKRVLKGSSFEKMGLTVAKSSNTKVSRTSTSSENSIKDQDSTSKEQISIKSSNRSKNKQKNGQVSNQNKVNIEIKNQDKSNVINSNNNKIEEKQKIFSASMKRLVKRMEGSMSVDLKTKMLATRLS